MVGREAKSGELLFRVVTALPAVMASKMERAAGIARTKIQKLIPMMRQKV